MTCSVVTSFWVQEEGKNPNSNQKQTNKQKRNITLVNFIWNHSWSWGCSTKSLQGFHTAWKTAKQFIYQLAPVSEQYLWETLTHFFQKNSHPPKKASEKNRYIHRENKVVVLGSAKQRARTVCLLVWLAVRSRQNGLGTLTPQWNLQHPKETA